MKGLRWLFARRYLFSPKSHSVINIISGVSAFAVGVPVAAMIVLLSVFNGFEEVVKGLYNDFDPDLAVTPAEGKIFTPAEIDTEAILSVDGVEAVSAILEDNALFEYRGGQFIGILRGVDDNYTSVVPMDRMISSGAYALGDMNAPKAVVGDGLAVSLGVSHLFDDPLKVYVPRRGSFSPLVPVDSYRSGGLGIAGRFALDAETDGKYALAPLWFARMLFDYPEGSSALMVKLVPGADPDRLRARVQEAAGEKFTVRTRYQQKSSFYNIMTYEKWGIFTIILMVLIIASFTTVGSMVMLIIEKKKDLRTILTMGGDIGLARGIFLREGMLVGAIGAAGGLALGLILCWVQLRFGVVRIPADTFLVDAYPVAVKASDVAVVALAFACVTYIITKFTVARMIPRSDIRIT